MKETRNIPFLRDPPRTAPIRRPIPANHIPAATYPPIHFPAGKWIGG